MSHARHGLDVPVAEPTTKKMRGSTNALVVNAKHAVDFSVVTQSWLGGVRLL